MRPSGDQKDGSLMVQYRECWEDEREKLKDWDFWGKVMASLFCVSAKGIVSGIFEDSCQNRFRVVCAEIKEINTRNLRVQPYMKMNEALVLPAVPI